MGTPFFTSFAGSVAATASTRATPLFASASALEALEAQYARSAATWSAVASPRAAASANASTATCRRSAECDASRFAEFTARHSVSAFTVTRVSYSASFL